MTHRSRLAAILTAAALAIALPATAHAATSQPGHVSGGAKPALAPRVVRHAAAATSNGVTASVTPTDVQGDGLTISFDATASTDSNTGASITGYSFDFGDSTNANNSTGTTTHQYAHPGTYTVSVTVTDSAGNSATVQNTVTTVGADFVPVAPTRILNTSTGLGAPEAKLTLGDVIALQVTNVDGVPADATGVVLHLTAINSVGGGDISCYPDGTTQPATSNLNYGDGIIGTLVTIPVAADGKIDCVDQGAAGSGTETDLFGDLQGYYAPTQASGYEAIQPGRIVNTGTGLGAPKAKISNGQSLTLTIAGATATISTATIGTTTETLPATGITAVALNLTAVNTTGNGLFTAYPDGTSEPDGTALNYSNDAATANAAIIPVGTDGKIVIANTGTVSTTTNLIVDVEGYYTASSPAVYVPSALTRLVDTRKVIDGAVGANIYYGEQNLTTANGITAYILNLTVTGDTDGGDIAVFPVGGPIVPSNDIITSNLNFSANATLANYVQATAGPTATGFLNQSSSTCQLIIDEYGYLTTQ